jgi:hypothetical protein
VPLDSLFHPLAELMEAIDRTQDLADAAALVAGFAVAHLGAEQAGLTVREPRARIRRLAATSSEVLLLDGVEASLGQGPRLSAPLDGEVVTIADTRLDRRWPEWCSAAAGTGLRAVRLVGMPGPRGRALILELFATRPRAFAADDFIRTAGTARHAGLALRHVDRVAHLETALLSRELIGQAQGIVMERYGLTSEQAMSFLRRHSQHSQTKIRDLARTLVESEDRALDELPVLAKDNDTDAASSGPAGSAL